MTLNNEKSVPSLSVGADMEQTSQTTEQIITNAGSKGKPKLSLEVKSLDEILDSYYPPVEPVINNLLYPGVVILAGSPKVGKSFLVAEIAYRVARGEPLWNEDYRTSQCRVLYMALEDGEKRSQNRFSRMFQCYGSPNLEFVYKSRIIAEGLVLQLEEYIRYYPDTRLIIIDTLQKARGGKNETVSYSRDYDAITQLKDFADQHGICLLVVHHTRKQESDDCFEKISGTNGLMGCADTAIIMTKKRGSTEAKLQITGRDQQDQLINIRHNQDTLCWEYDSSETALWKEPTDPVIEKVILFTEKVTEWEGTATELAGKLGIDMEPNVLSRKLNAGTSKLWNDHKIEFRLKRTAAARLIHLEKCLL